MKLLLPLLFVFVAACSTLSQTIETPVVMAKKKFAAGGGAVYAHNLYQNDLEDGELDEYKPNIFFGGRYGLARNIEVAAAGGTAGLTAGSGLDLRIRYQYYNGWRPPVESDRDDDDDSAKDEEANDDVGGEDFSDDDDELLADGPDFVANGWVSTVSLGFFWSGFNKLENFSVNQYDGGAYLSNSVGYKSNNWVYYFGGKVMQLETEYRYKANRFTTIEDINSKYNEFTFGVFGGVTYQWQTRKKHGYMIDILLSVMQLPKSALDRTNSFYPALTASLWYVD